MKCVSHWVVNPADVVADAVIQMPHVRCRHGDVVGETAVAVDADNARTGVDVRIPRAAENRSFVDNVSFGRHAVARLDGFHEAADGHHIAGEFVPNHKWRLAATRRPRIPLVNVDVRSAHAGTPHFDQHLIVADAWFGHFSERQPFPCRRFDQRFHEYSDGGSRTSCHILRGESGRRRSPTRPATAMREGQNWHDAPSGGRSKTVPDGANSEMLRSVFARVLYTRYCAMQLSTRIFASYQRLAHDVHILFQRVHAEHESRDDEVRRPYRNRVAIKRHEFPPKFRVALSTHRFADGTDIPSVASTSSPRATVRSVVVSTTPVLRPVGGAPHDRSASIASSGCPALATVPSQLGASTLLLLALPLGESSPARASWRPCSA